VLGAIAIAIAARRLRTVQPLRETVQEVGRSVEAIAAVTTSNGAPAPHTSVRG
jgi:hypothetical protein